MYLYILIYTNYEYFCFFFTLKDKIQPHYVKSENKILHNRIKNKKKEEKKKDKKKSDPLKSSNHIRSRATKERVPLSKCVEWCRGSQTDPPRLSGN